MSLAPLFNASPAIQIHAFAAMAALILGAMQLLRAKGTVSHRVIGWIWVALLLTICAISFWIHTIRQFAGFSLIHLLSILTLVMVPVAVHAARQGRISAHRKGMISIYFFALLVAGIFTLMPGRILGRVLFGG